MTINDIKKVNWKYLINRKEPLLFLSISGGSGKYSKQATGIPKILDNRIHFSNGDILYGAVDLERMNLVFSKGGYKTFFDFRNRLIKHVQNSDKIAREIEKINCHKLASAQLNKLIIQYLKVALYAHSFLISVAAIDKILSKKILDELPEASESQKQKWLKILTYPSKENEQEKEERSFYDLAFIYKHNPSGKEFSKELQKHLQKFSKIGARLYFWHNAWTEDDIKKRLDQFLKQNKSSKKELNNLYVVRQNSAKDFNKLVEHLKIKNNSTLFKLIKITKEYVYLRTWRTNILYGSGYRARELFYEIAKRANINKKDIYYLTYQEIIKAAKNNSLPISTSELKNRKEFFVDCFIKGKSQVFSGKKYKKKLKSIINVDVQPLLKIIKGNTAYPGKIKGQVKVLSQGINSKINIDKVKSGDIMVATMTFPNFIPAMEKAAAFITDEGGILCHAAIVAREMKKPCVIGTKIATKVLKDGDRVEVDANKGVVKKI